MIVCHRVVRNNEFDGWFSTKGDANDQEDLMKVQYDELIGIVEHHYPFLGTAGSYISTSSGKLFMGELIVVCLLMFVISDRIKV